MTTRGTEPLHVAVRGLPDGLVALVEHHYRTTADGDRVPMRNRRGGHKVDRVRLVSRATAARVSGAIDPWVLDADRRQWRSIQKRYGAEAWPRALELAHAGVVALHCEVLDDMSLSDPTKWSLTDAAAHLRHQRHADREEHHQRLAEHAEDAAAAIADRHPELADALRIMPPGRPTLPVLIHAAEDLAAGVRHPGPRAFSQAHFTDTKARDDAANVLRAAGVPEHDLDALGLTRAGRIGLAGPVAVHHGSNTLVLRALAGPVLLRADQAGLDVSLLAPAALVIVENLQAAEAVADQHPDTAIVYTAGPPSEGALKLITQLAGDAMRTLIVPDADLGGVRIAERVLRAAPDAELVDIGSWPHPPGRPFVADGVSERGLAAAVEGAAGALARACLDRTYRVEQELATVTAVGARLRAN